MLWRGEKRMVAVRYGGNNLGKARGLRRDVIVLTGGPPLVRGARHSQHDEPALFIEPRDAMAVPEHAAKKHQLRHERGQAQSE